MSQLQDVGTGSGPGPGGAVDRRQVLSALLSDGDERLTPVSAGQRRLWFVDGLSAGSSDYVVVWPLRLSGVLDVGALQRAVEAVVARHETLRSRFVPVDGEPVAVVGAAGPVPLRRVDLSGLAEPRRSAEVSRVVGEAGRRPFDLAVGPLTRWSLVRVSAVEHVLVVSAHHIVFDGWSGSVLLGELSVLYGAFVRGEGSPLGELAVQFADFVVWEREWLAGEVLAEQVGFWREYLRGAPAVVDLPTDLPRPPRRSGAGDRVRFEFPVGLSEGLAGLCRAEGATVFMGLLAGLDVVVGRAAGVDDVVVGSFVANRSAPELEGLIGFFVNTVVFRGDLSGCPSFRELLGRVRAGALEVFAHQEVPFDRVVEEVAPQRQVGATPFVQVALVVQNLPEEVSRLGDVVVESLPAQSSSATFDLSFHVWPTGSGGLAGFVEFATDLYTAESVERMVGHWRHVLAQVVADPLAPVDTLVLPGPDEQVDLAAAATAAPHRPPVGRCLHELVADQVAARPDAVAVSCGGGQLTYRELDERSTVVARRLRAAGVGPDVLVGVCIARSTESVVGLLGVLRAGGAYVPLDPENPVDRLHGMVDDAGLTRVLATSATRHLVPDGLDVLLVDQLPTTTSGGLPPVQVSPDHLAYVIHTSGSTGRPKGVAVTHAAAVSRVHRPDYAPIGTDDVVLHALALSFDVSVLEVFGALTNGAELAVLPGKAVPERLEAFLPMARVTVAWMTAALFHAVVDLAPHSVGGVRALIAGGDQLSSGHTATALAHLGEGAVLVNGYGPTEAAIFAATHTMHPGDHVPDRVPIGRPVAHTELHVLDRAGQPCPVGVPGELHIGGACLARGYLGRPGLTAERFVPHPSADGARLYRTGDVVRRLPDHTLQFLGRTDHQVKVRGFRVELGEVEERLRARPGVGDAAVVARPDQHGDRTLVAFVQPADGASRPGEEELLAHLRSALPAHMVPRSLVVLDRLPLSPSGKVDRGALEHHGTGAPDRDGVGCAPRTADEQLIADVWCDLLELDRIGVDEDFFDLGGHSLLASRLVARVRSASGRELSLADFFAAPTVAGTAQALGTTAAGRPVLRPVARPGRLPVSMGQRRLWFVDGLSAGSSDYVVVWPLRLSGVLDVGALQRAVEAVVARHETLRSRFVPVDGEPTTVVDPPGAVDLTLLDVGSSPHPAAEVSRVVGEAGRRPFDLAVGPLTRWSLVRVSAVEHVLVVSAHHIVFDGWSGSVLLGELSVLYGAFVRGEGSPLGELAVQFADFVVWEREWLAGEVLAEQVGFWREYLRGAPAVVDLPTDLPRPPRRSGAGDRVRFEFPVGLSEGLAGLCRAEGATVFMGLLAGLDVVVGRAAGVDDVVVGSFVANRSAPELEGLIGFFVNTVVFRGDLSGCPSFRELLGRVRAGALEVFAHQEVPFDRVVEEVAPQRQVGATPFVQVALVVQNLPEEVSRLGDVVVESLPAQSSSATFDLSFHVWPTGSGGLAGFVEFATDLYTAESVERMVGHWRHVLAQVVADPLAPVDTLVLPGPDERHRIVHELVPGPVLELGDDSLVARFTRGAVETPDAAAFTDGGAQLTHRELDERSGVLARLLTRAGVGHGTTVGVHLPPGLELPVAVLAVWKVGGTYVPLDVQHPTARTAHLLADAGVGTVLTTADLAAALPAGPSLLLLDDLPVDQGAHSAAQPPLATPDDVVAVIYTSGSTGAPKGVEITARAVVNRVGWFAAQCPAAPGDVACMKTPIAFVDSLAELLGGVLQGIPTVVVGTDQGRDPCALVDVLARGGVTRFLLVPTLLRALLAHVEDLGSALPALRLWVCSGEPLPGDLAQQFAAQLPGRSLHNLYGSAEAWDSSWSPSWSSSSSSSSEVPIGSPLANVELHVLDGAGQPAPVGARGHLHVGGACLARGYRGRPDLTAERFVPHPYLPGARLYRTGDRARLLPDGQVQLAGRVDHQLKVRGSRVEPGEVERALEAVPAVRQAAVVPWRRGGTGGTELAAFVVTDGSVTAAQVRTAARAALPAHLVPSSITVVDDLPSTVTGKLDRSALPAPVEAAREPVGEPGSALEQRLAELWAQVLGVDVVGVHEDFFDLGGHSLLAAQLADLVGRSTVSRVPVSAVFEHPTVHRLAVLLEGRADGTDGDRPC